MNLSDKRILVIDKEGAFTTRAICESFKQKGFLVDHVEANIEVINGLTDMPNIIFVNLEENVSNDSQFMTDLRDLAIEKRKLLFFIGYGPELVEATSAIPSKIIGYKFERPININEIGEIIEEKITISLEKMEKRSILVVDDSGLFLRTIHQILEPFYNVSLVNSATNAISFLATNKPELILLDYEMPVCSGPQLYEMIKADPSTCQIPIMFLTSKDDMESVKSVLGLKPQGYILKTQQSNQIVDIIENYFEQKKPGEL